MVGDEAWRQLGDAVASRWVVVAALGDGRRRLQVYAVAEESAAATGGRAATGEGGCSGDGGGLGSDGAGRMAR